jgi:hypothetical protein
MYFAPLGDLDKLCPSEATVLHFALVEILPHEFSRGRYAYRLQQRISARFDRKKYPAGIRAMVSDMIPRDH